MSQQTKKIVSHKVQPGLKPKAGIANMIAIGSGKGGVGKSTVTVNIALSLVELGYSVGILDADIYGASQAMLLGMHAKPEVQDAHFIPLQCHGLSMISMGVLVGPEKPMIWRGPMLSGALLQLANQTKWPELDFLLIDLPPGTGDVQLTMAQKLPISGAVIVTTPQALSVLDAQKAIAMFRQVNITVLGVIENMSTHHCLQCGHTSPLFGEGGGAQLAKAYEVPLLGSLPLEAKIGEQSDQGLPIVCSEPNAPSSLLFKTIALNIVHNLSQEPREYTAFSVKQKKQEDAL